MGINEMFDKIRCISKKKWQPSAKNTKYNDQSRKMQNFIKKKPQNVNSL